ncbi:hypothetical protein [Streptomyces sp. NPDC004629]|uniref:hypothetical protein n=1 Tax=Streptomyces sp. NPDC004629 TaxID=3364705 RepID=UPI0036BF2786
MSGFVEALLERVSGARAGLAVAREAQDAYEVALALDELDDALRIARANGIDVEPDPDTKGEG